MVRSVRPPGAPQQGCLPHSGRGCVRRRSDRRPVITPCRRRPTERRGALALSADRPVRLPLGLPLGWVALDRAAKLAEIRGDPELSATWAATAEEIKADILEHGVDDRGVLRQHYVTDALDASTLLAALFGFLPARDLMERLLNVAAPLGLYAEAFDADTGRHLGNFPQAFSQLALIEAAGRIIVAERLAELNG
jgi:hypothetical protein